MVQTSDTDYTTDGTGLTLNGANKKLLADTGLTIGSNADGEQDIDFRWRCYSINLECRWYNI